MVLQTVPKMDKRHVEVAIRAARTGAAELMRYRNGFSVREKAPKDLVTDADLASQHAIFSVLRQEFPDEAMVGEEEGHDRPPPETAEGASDQGVSQPCWIVDPLDGTLNYVHRLQHFCVSIGLILGDQLQLGVVLDPVGDELFCAVRGGGAWVSRTDGSHRAPLQASPCRAIGDALLACSFAAGARRDSLEVAQFGEVLEACRSLRRLGSCALNLCYVAAGRLDGYWARSVRAWDVAAGALIVEEAGGVIGPLEGERLDVWNPRFCAAATIDLQRQVLAIVRS